MTATIDIDAPPAPEDDARLTRQAVERLRLAAISVAAVIAIAVVAATVLILATRPGPSPLEQVQTTCKVGLLDRDGALVVDVVQPYPLAPMPAIDGDDGMYAHTMVCLVGALKIPDAQRAQIFDLIGQAMVVQLDKPIDTALFWPGYTLKATAEKAGRLRLRFVNDGG